jgi:pentatricopeptide repeat protein
MGTIAASAVMQCALQLDTSTALRVFQRLTTLNVRLHKYTHHALLKVLRKAMLMDVALEVFQRMEVRTERMHD